MKSKLFAAVTVVVLFILSGQASALTISAFRADDTTEINQWITGLGNNVQTLENFENVDTGWYHSLNTSFGTFSANGDIGLGQTSYNANNNPNLSVPFFSIRDSAWYGRGNTTHNGRRYLDTGDITGLTLTLSSNYYTNLFFYLQDPSDVGAKTTIGSADQTIDFSNLENGSLWFIGISSDNYLDSITWATSNQNDGFGLDDFRTVAPVPEPATMLLLGTGLLGFAGIGRKKWFKR